MSWYQIQIVGEICRPHVGADVNGACQLHVERQKDDEYLLGLAMIDTALPNRDVAANLVADPVVIVQRISGFTCHRLQVIQLHTWGSNNACCTPRSILVLELVSVPEKIRTVEAMGTFPTLLVRSCSTRRSTMISGRTVKLSKVAKAGCSDMNRMSEACAISQSAVCLGVR